MRPSPIISSTQVHLRKKHHTLVTLKRRENGVTYLTKKKIFSVA